MPSSVIPKATRTSAHSASSGTATTGVAVGNRDFLCPQTKKMALSHCWVSSPWKPPRIH